MTTNGTFVVPKTGKAAVCVNPGPDYSVKLVYVRLRLVVRFVSRRIDDIEILRGLFRIIPYRRQETTTCSSSST